MTLNIEIKHCFKLMINSLKILSHVKTTENYNLYEPSSIMLLVIFQLQIFNDPNSLKKKKHNIKWYCQLFSKCATQCNLTKDWINIEHVMLIKVVVLKL